MTMERPDEAFGCGDADFFRNSVLQDLDLIPSFAD
jgi:hypothetical protein